jgi:hypothetical protein
MVPVGKPFEIEGEIEPVGGAASRQNDIVHLDLGGQIGGTVAS